MNWNRIFILAVYDLRHAVFRLKGLVFLLPFLFFWYWTLKFLYEKGADLLVSRESIFLLSWLFKPAVAQVLLIAHPASLSVFLLVALATTPFFAMLGSSDQLAGDAARQSFRYLLTRCTRTEIFLGRLVSSYSLVAGTTLLAAAAATCISWQIDHRAPDVTLVYAAQVVIMALLYILPYVTYMGAISSMMSSALSTLLMGVMIYLTLAMTGGYLSNRFSLDIALVPGGIKELLLGIHPRDQLYAGLGLLAYTTVYGVLGWFMFQRRNL
jgi:hypothetical protein